MDVSGIIYQHQSANTPSIKTSTTALADNNTRGAFSIQNLDSNYPLYVLLGLGASNTLFHFILKKSSGSTVGDGGIFSMESGCVFTGPISVYSAGTPSYTILEI